MKQSSLRWHAIALTIIVAMLIIIGLLFIYSASAVFGMEKCASAHYFVQKQLLGLFLGIIALGITRSLPIKLLQHTSPLAALASVAATALTLIPGFASTIHGSSRWLHIGISWQPSELLKISLILYTSALLARQTTTGVPRRTWYYFLLLLGATTIILLKQPDFGLMITLLATIAIMFFIANVAIKQLLLAGIGSIPLLMALILWRPYRLKRILAFLNPWQDPHGAGFQIIQSLIAIGSGGWCGVGIGHSKQKFFYLPMQHTDFIFAIIAEETGFIGCSIIILLYLLLLYVGLRIAWQLTNRFCSFTVLGFTLLIHMQTIINLFVILGLVPTKGIGLPFISAGNSALIVHLAMIGIILGMARKEK